MEGLLEIAPVSVPVEIGGCVWPLSPLRLADYAEMERYILQKHASPIEAARLVMEGQSDHAQKQMLGRAFDEVRRADRVAREEMDAWLQSEEGIFFEFWRRLRSAQPEMTLGKVHELFGDQAVEVSAKMAKAAQMTGEYALGNSSSRGRTLMHPAAANRFLGEVFSAA